MDEARAVLEQLRTVEALAAAEADPEVVVAELGALVDLVDRWLAAEPGAREAVIPPLERCRLALGAARETKAVAV